MLDTKRFVEFLIRYQLSPSQFLFLHLILNKEYAQLYQYCQELRAFTRKEIDDMVEKGYLINNGKVKDALYADNFDVTMDFRKLLYTNHPEKMFTEFWNSFPNFLFINSKRVPTKACNMEELEKRYINLVKKNVPLHNSIMNAIEWGKSRGYLNSGIIKFFDSRAWEYIQVEMKESIENGELPAENQF